MAELRMDAINEALGLFASAIKSGELWAMLDRYRCHKVVRAARISDVVVEPYENVNFVWLRLDVPAAKGGVIWQLVGREAVARYMPVAGDYFVVYADGYQSISPKKAFEDGYSLQEAVSI